MCEEKIVRCQRCILPENYPEIWFNEQGVCNYCLDDSAPDYLGEEKPQHLLNSIKGRGYKYDCLIPISGGRDSMFVLYQIKTKYTMNVLAYNYDNGFTSTVAKENVIRATDKMGVDLVSLKSKRDIQCKNLTHVIKLNIHKSPAHVIPSLCEGCAFGIWGGAYKVAKAKGIPLVIFGESKNSLEFILSGSAEINSIEVTDDARSHRFLSGKAILVANIYKLV